jgi:hypothetical protein
MAVNHADGMIFTSVIIYPIAAAVGAAHAGAGWLTVFFIPVGLAAGIGVFRFGRAPVYAITGFGLSHASKMPRNWIQQIFFPAILSSVYDFATRNSLGWSVRDLGRKHLARSTRFVIHQLRVLRAKIISFMRRAF